jgi:hypothetical protein
MARALSRTAADTAAPFAFELLRAPEGAVLVAERRSAGADQRPAALRVSAAGEIGDALDLRRVAPGRYEAHVRLGRDEGLRVVAGTSNAPPRLRLALEPLAGGARELQVDPVRAERLAAALSPLAVPGDPGAGPVRWRELSPWFAALALLLYLLDIAHRRWPREAVTSSR